MIMEEEVYQFTFSIFDVVKKLSGRFPLGHPYYLNAYTRGLGRLLSGEVKHVVVEHVVRNGVPRGVRNDVKEWMKGSDLRQVVRYFHIQFSDLADYDFWVVIFGMRCGLCSYCPVTLVYRHSTLISIDDFCSFCLL